MKFRAVAVALLALVGLIDALYLSIKRNTPVPCHITHGCENVLTSKYSAIAGVPLSYIGVAFYLTMLSLAVFTLFDEQERPGGGPFRLIFYLSGAGLIVSALLVGIQAFIIKAFCEYCLLSASLVLTIFLVSPNPGSREKAPVSGDLL